MFNEAQLEAIEHGKGPAIVLAGPGTGKTTVITHRVKRLIEKKLAEPEEILVVTFTKMAAMEMQQRFFDITQDRNVAYKINFGTLHSIFLNIIKEHENKFGDIHILSETDRKRILKEIILRLGVDDFGDILEFIKIVSGEISKIKGDGTGINEFVSDICDREEFLKIYYEYEKALEGESAIDFDDMILKCNVLLKENRQILEYWQQRYKYILVDEFQDINLIQYRNIKMLAGLNENLFVVGDDDQTIYGFRGASPEIMLNFNEDFKKAQTIKLNINYRSTSEILEVSARLINNNHRRNNKNLISYSGSGEKIDIREFDTNINQYQYISDVIKRYIRKGIRPEDIAILVRNNKSIPVIKNFLQNRNVSVSANRRMSIYNHHVARDIISYIKASLSDLSLPLIKNTDLLKVINKPYRYISRQFIGENGLRLIDIKKEYAHSREILNNIEELEFHLNMIKELEPYPAINYIRYGVNYDKYMKEYEKSRGVMYENMSKIYEEIQNDALKYKSHEEWLEYVEDDIEKNEEDSEGVKLITMHGAKGLEYKAVFIPDANQGIIPGARAIRDENIEEERRIFYVALTRASRYLHIYSSGNIMGRKFQSSQFINEMCTYLQF